jgi:hypothetical protein
VLMGVGNIRYDSSAKSGFIKMIAFHSTKMKFEKNLQCRESNKHTRVAR